MRLNRTIAENTAKELVKKRKEESKILMIQLGKDIQDAVINSTPKNVLECYLNNKEYFISRSLALRDKNRNTNYFEIKAPILKSRYNISDHITDTNEMSILEDRLTSINNLNTEIELKEKELVEIILGFRTLKVLSENFKEASEIVEKTYNVVAVKSQLPATQMKELINWINK